MTLETSRKTIGLCMIVKDEAHVIERCLDSVRPLIDYALIEDTGSTDGTQQKIRDWLARHAMPGVVLEEPWVDFAQNRSHALAALRAVDSVDYALIIDADDTLAIDTGVDIDTLKRSLTHDSYTVDVLHGPIRHVRTQICSNRLPFRYRGAVHEFIDCEAGTSSGHLAGVSIRIVGGGARSGDPRRYQRDAELIERALATEEDAALRARYTFYLAQSYRDSGEPQKALDAYLRRAAMGFWQEEVYISFLWVARLKERLGYDPEDVIATYQQATACVSARAEAIHGAAKFCRTHSQNQRGYEIARRGLNLPVPHGLFIEEWIYQYGLRDEYAVNAYWAGAYKDSLDASLQLLVSGTLPAEMIPRVTANAKHAADRLPPAPNLGRLGADTMVAQHALTPDRSLHSSIADPPTVLIAILAKQKEKVLPLYLECIEALDYPKSRLSLYIRTNNNTDRTEQLLNDWIRRVGHLYGSVEYDASDVDENVQQFREHEWNPVRFNVLARIRNASLKHAVQMKCGFYFVADVDNFIRSSTLRELVALNLPIVSPLLRSIRPEAFYSNFHAEIDNRGYYAPCDQYHWILSRFVRGIIEVPVIHCTYLIRSDAIPLLTYSDGTSRHEYVIFSDSARSHGIPQYIDNRQIYGYITFGEGNHHVANGIDQARNLIGAAETRLREILADASSSSDLSSPNAETYTDSSHNSCASPKIRKDIGASEPEP
jgi:glycosyltransferase involved in cell wall biosynthesis